MAKFLWLLILATAVRADTKCEDFPIVPNFDLDRWLEHPIKLVSAITTGYTECTATIWERFEDTSNNDEVLRATLSGRFDGNTTLMNGTATPVAGRPGHFKIYYESSFNWEIVVLDTDYESSSALATCLFPFPMGQVTSTSSDIDNEELMARIEQLEANGIDTDGMTFGVHDDQCNYYPRPN